MKDLYDRIISNRFTLITADTGWGKSTEIPKMFYEFFPGKVIVTQPRIIATQSVSKRVAQLAKVEHGKEIGFKNSKAQNCIPTTKLLFVTDGLQMIKELTEKDTTPKFIIVDEVHEWNVNMEILVAWILENNMKAVFLSATVDSVEFMKFLKQTDSNSEHIHFEGRKFPVSKKQISEYDFVSQVVMESNMGNNSLVFVSGKKEINETVDKLTVELTRQGVFGYKVLPLHSELSQEEQQEIFTPQKKIIVATNIAQTSITVPDLDTVFSFGKKREIVYNAIERLEEVDCSQSDLLQQAGRVGRTKPGTFYLVSKISLDNRNVYNISEIQRRDLSTIILKLESFGLKIKTMQLFHKPSEEQINDSYSLLEKFELMKNTISTKNGGFVAEQSITDYGRQISKMPYSVLNSILIDTFKKDNMLHYGIVVSSILEVGNIFFTTEEQQRPLSKLSSCRKSEITAIMEALEKLKNQKLTGKDLKEKYQIIPKKYFELLDKIRKSSFDFGSKEISFSNTDEQNKKIRHGIYKTFRNQFYFQNGYNDKFGNRDIDRKSVVGYTSYAIGFPHDIRIINKRGNKMTIPLINMATDISDFVLGA